MRQDADDDLEDHERDDEQERDGQIPSIGVRAHGVRMAVAVVVVMMTVVTVVVHGSILARPPAHARR